MAAPVRKDPAGKTASAVRRGSSSSGAGNYGVRQGTGGGDEHPVWIKIEAVADIAPMENPYFSWDPSL